MDLNDYSGKNGRKEYPPENLARQGTLTVRTFPRKTPDLNQLDFSRPNLIQAKYVKAYQHGRISPQYLVRTINVNAPEWRCWLIDCPRQFDYLFSAFATT